MSDKPTTPDAPSTDELTAAAELGRLRYEKQLREEKRGLCQGSSGKGEVM